MKNFAVKETRHEIDMIAQVNVTAERDIRCVFRISAGDQEDNIHDERRRKLPQNGAEIHKIQVDFPYRRFYPQGHLY